MPDDEKRREAQRKKPHFIVTRETFEEATGEEKLQAWHIRDMPKYDDKGAEAYNNIIGWTVSQHLLYEGTLHEYVIGRYADKVVELRGQYRNLLNTILSTYHKEDLQLRTIHTLFLWNTDALGGICDQCGSNLILPIAAQQLEEDLEGEREAFHQRQLTTRQEERNLEESGRYVKSTYMSLRTARRYNLTARNLPTIKETIISEKSGHGFKNRMERPRVTSTAADYVEEETLWLNPGGPLSDRFQAEF